MKTYKLLPGIEMMGEDFSIDGRSAFYYPEVGQLKIPAGWRLPTVSEALALGELHLLGVGNLWESKKVMGLFYHYYWINLPDPGVGRSGVLSVSEGNPQIMTLPKLESCRIRLVRDI